MGFLDSIGASKFLPEAGFSGIFSGLVKGFGVIFMILFVALVVGGIAYYIIQLRKYNQKITIFEEVRGRLIPTRKDIGMLVSSSPGGTKLLWAKKNKAYLNSYGEKIDKNHYAFVLGSDGIPVNATFASWDKSLREIKLRPTQAGIRLLHENVGRHAAFKYSQKNWLKENIGLIVSIGAIIIVLLFMWLLADKYIAGLELAGQRSEKIIEAADGTLVKLNDVLTTIDNICTRGAITQGATVT